MSTSNARCSGCMHAERSTHPPGWSPPPCRSRAGLQGWPQPPRAGSWAHPAVQAGRQVGGWAGTGRWVDGKTGCGATQGGWQGRVRATAGAVAQQMSRCSCGRLCRVRKAGPGSHAARLCTAHAAAGPTPDTPPRPAHSLKPRRSPRAKAWNPAAGAPAPSSGRAAPWRCCTGSLQTWGCCRAAGTRCVANAAIHASTGGAPAAIPKQRLLRGCRPSGSGQQREA